MYVLILEEGGEMRIEIILLFAFPISHFGELKVKSRFLRLKRTMITDCYYAFQKKNSVPFW